MFVECNLEHFLIMTIKSFLKKNLVEPRQGLEIPGSAWSSKDNKSYGKVYHYKNKLEFPWGRGGGG